MFKKILPISILALLTALYWYKLICSSMTVYWEIMYKFMYPFIMFYSESLRNFSIPLWNPYLCCGTPFAAMLQTQVFYPFNLLFVFFNFPIALNIYIIVHTFLAGFFMYILTRYNNFGEKESLLASAIFMFNGFFIYHFEFIHHISAYIWLPVIFYFFQRAIDELKTRYFIITSALLTIQFFGGYPQFSYYTMLILASFLILRLFTISTLANKFKIAGLSAFSLILFIFLAAIQIIPTLELMGLSERAHGLSFGTATAYSLTLKEIMTFLFIPLWNTFFSKVYHDAQTTGFYFGILTPVIIFLSLKIKNNKFLIYYFLFLAFSGLLLALGTNTPVYNLFLNYFPGMKYFRFPVQCIFFSIFGISFLSAYGLSYFKNEKIKAIILLFFVADLFLFGQHCYNLMDNTFFYKQKPPSWLPVKIENKYYRTMMNPLTFEKLKNYLPESYDDCINYQDTNIPNFPVTNKLYDINGYIILGVNNYQSVLSKLFKQGYNSKLINLLNVKYLVSNQVINNQNWLFLKSTNYGINVYENKKMLPRALFLRKPKYFETSNEALQYLGSGNFQPDKEILLLSKDRVPEGAPIPARTAKEAQINITKYEPGKIELSVKNAAQGWLLLTETYYPGWKVFIDGKEGIIERGDYAFQAVYFEKPALNHSLKFVYDPISFKIGAILSILAWIVVLLYTIVAGIKNMLKE